MPPSPSVNLAGDLFGALFFRRAERLSGWSQADKYGWATFAASSCHMNTFPQFDVDSLDPNDRTQVIDLVRRLLKSNNPGVLSTVDQSGFPQSRWMATMSFDDFPNLYTLTAANSRKVAQIKDHPIVQWMFSDRDWNFVVNLTGRAELYLRDADAMQRIWRQIVDRSRAYFMNTGDGSGFAVIHTKVEMVECYIPKRSLRFLIDPQELIAANP
jgi:general stress protein 26